MGAVVSWKGDAITDDVAVVAHVGDGGGLRRAGCQTSVESAARLGCR